MELEWGPFSVGRLGCNPSHTGWGDTGWGHTGSWAVLTCRPCGFSPQVSFSALKEQRAGWATLDLMVSPGLADRKDGKVRSPGTAGGGALLGPPESSSPFTGSKKRTSPCFPPAPSLPGPSHWGAASPHFPHTQLSAGSPVSVLSATFITELSGNTGPNMGQKRCTVAS